MTYLDYCATTPPSPEVIEVVQQMMMKFYGNPSSLHEKGIEAEKLLSQAREVAAKALGVKKEEVIFTSGGTEGNNTAIKGAAYQYQSRGMHLITTQIEHPSVYDCFQQLASFGFDVTYVPVDSNGIVQVSEIEKAITDETTLISVMHVNNETGAIQPIEKIGELLKKHPKILFHVDAVQGFAKVPLDIKGFGIDLLTLSGHKFHAPKGVGVLYVREGIRLQPLLAGGGQEKGIRSGTENVPLIVGLAKAMRVAKEQEKENIRQLSLLKSKIIEAARTWGSCNIYTPEHSAPHVISLGFPHLKGEVLVHALEQKGYYVSTRSACSSKLEKPSRILLAMGIPKEEAKHAIRISLSADVTIDEIDRFISVLFKTVNELKIALRV